jgi:hypothetical protein
VLKISDKKRQNLFIIYYGGHGVQNNDGKCFWTPNEKVPKGSPIVECARFQNYLAKADCDILFLFDCCFATAMIHEGHQWKRRCEILGAAGPVNKAGGKAAESFTAALTTELRQLKSNGISVLQLYANVTSKEKIAHYKLKTTPAYRKFWIAPDLANIFLGPVKPKDSSLSSDQPGQGAMVTADNLSTGGSSVTLRDLSTSTEARILFSLKFRNPAEKPVAKEILQWLENKPHDAQIEVAVYRELAFHGLFESDSGLALMSMPIWLWASLPPNTAFQYVGVVRSDNLLSLEQFQAPKPVPEKISQRPSLDSINHGWRTQGRGEASGQATRGRRSMSNSNKSSSRSPSPPRPAVKLFALPKKKRRFFSEPTLDDMTRSLNKSILGRIVERPVVSFPIEITLCTEP